MPKDATEMAALAAAILSQRWTELISSAEASAPMDALETEDVRAAI